MKIPYARKLKLCHWSPQAALFCLQPWQSPHHQPCIIPLFWSCLFSSRSLIFPPLSTTGHPFVILPSGLFVLLPFPSSHPKWHESVFGTGSLRSCHGAFLSVFVFLSLFTWSLITAHTWKVFISWFGVAEKRTSFAFREKTGAESHCLGRRFQLSAGEHRALHLPAPGLWEDRAPGC